MSDPLISPWPGPRPYTDTEALLLESRDEELGEFGELLLKSTKKVIQLSAKSGVGKTSFLQAKLLPTLRRAGFVTLIYRDWAPVGVKASGTAARKELYAFTVDKAIESFEKSTGTSLELGPDLSIVERLRAVAAVAKKANPRAAALLVFDQFEELLRRDPRLGRGFLDEVVRVAKDAPVKQLISLRSEFSEELRKVHGDLGSYAAAMTLKELEGPRLKSVIVRPPRQAPFEIEVTDSACKEILRWWDQARERQTEARGEAEVAEVNRLGVADVGLLHLQAVLWALYQHWKVAATDRTRIDFDDVTAFAKWLGANSEVAVLTESLLRWVDRALLVPDDDPAESRLLRLATDVTVSLAQQLSAGGYKTTAELYQLAETCIGDEIARLGVEASSIEPAVRMCLEALGRPGERLTEPYSLLLGRVAGGSTGCSPSLGRRQSTVVSPGTCIATTWWPGSERPRIPTAGSGCGPPPFATRPGS